MMNNIVDWLLSQMNMSNANDDEYEQVEQGKAGSVFLINVKSYADCKLVLDNYSRGNICVFKLDSFINSDVQGMMNYICGGLYILNGEVSTVGTNVFMVIRRKENS